MLDTIAHVLCMCCWTGARSFTCWSRHSAGAVINDRCAGALSSRRIQLKRCSAAIICSRFLHLASLRLLAAAAGDGGAAAAVATAAVAAAAGACTAFAAALTAFHAICAV